MSSGPRLSVIVPCYRLAHLLGECLETILEQSVGDLEVLVMDDCSPDDVGAVIARIGDSRVHHLRHAANLGHLRNYNAGLGVARGEYVWLISADDRLSDAWAAARLLSALDRHPGAAFAFSPAIRGGVGVEETVYGAHGTEDALFRPNDFARRLIRGNPIPAPAAVVRGVHYRQGLRFPLDLPFVGDWYIWARLALEHDVAYVSQPVARYRVHAGNMTKTFLADPAALVRDEVQVRWKLKADAEALGRRDLAADALDVVADDYAHRVSRAALEQWRYGMSLPQFEASIAARSASARDLSLIRARVYAALGDVYYESDERRQAGAWYNRALQQRRGDARTLAKRGLLACGPAGVLARAFLHSKAATRRMEP